MLGCSALFNMSVRDWSAYRWELQLADHLGILLLIAGTYTPFMMHAGSSAPGASAGGSSACVEEALDVWCLGARRGVS